MTIPTKKPKFKSNNPTRAILSGLCVLLFCVVGHSHSPTCESVFNRPNTVEAPALAALLVQARNSNAIWRPGECFSNAGELARAITSRFGSSLDLKDLAIVVIKNSEASNPMVAERSFPLRHTIVGMNARSGQSSENGRHFVLWKFHTVLEYRGTIFDLDWRGSATPVAASTYFETMFRAIRADFVKRISDEAEDLVPIQRNYNQWSTMELIRVPVADYLARFSSRPEVTDNIEFALAHPKTGLVDYLNGIRSPRP